MSLPDSPTERYPYVSTSERRRHMDEIFFTKGADIMNPPSKVAKAREELKLRRAMQEVAFNGYLQDAAANEHNASMVKVLFPKHYTLDDVKRLKTKPPAATMTTPRRSFRNWIEELPRWTPHALRASALITAILYGVAL